MGKLGYIDEKGLKAIFALIALVVTYKIGEVLTPPITIIDPIIMYILNLFIGPICFMIVGKIFLTPSARIGNGGIMSALYLTLTVVFSAALLFIVYVISWIYYLWLLFENRNGKVFLLFVIVLVITTIVNLLINKEKVKTDINKKLFNAIISVEVIIVFIISIITFVIKDYFNNNFFYIITSSHLFISLIITTIMLISRKNRFNKNSI